MCSEGDRVFTQLPGITFLEVYGDNPYLPRLVGAGILESIPASEQALSSLVLRGDTEGLYARDLTWKLQ